MANKVLVKRSAVPGKVPTTSDLDLGELGVNTYDGKLYIKKDAGTPTIIDLTPPVASSTTPAALGTAAVGTGTTFARADHVHATEIPTQTGNSGKFLTTNGTTTSWGTASGALGYAYGGTITTAPIANGEDSLAIGDGASTSTSINGIAIGKNSSVGANAQSGIAIGEEARVTTSSSGMNTIALGKYAYAGGAFSSGFAYSIGSGRTGSTTYGAINLRTIAMGYDSIASGTDAISIGINSTASGNSTVAIGSSNTFNGGAQATGNNSVAIGAGSTATGNNTIAIVNNTGSGCSGIQSVVIGNCISRTAPRTVGVGYTLDPAVNSDTNVLVGYTIQHSGPQYNTIAIGSSLSNLAGMSSTAIIGDNIRADFSGEISFGQGGFSSTNTAKIGYFPMRMTTTTATVTELAMTGSSSENTSITPTGKIILINDSTYMFDVDIIARNTTTDTESAAWNLKFAIRRGAAAANTALIGTPTKTIFGQDTGTTTWDVNVTADTTNGRPNISVTGEAAKTIRWVANVRMTKVTG